MECIWQRWPMPSIEKRVQNLERDMDKIIKKFLLILGELKALKWIAASIVAPVYVALIIGLVKLVEGMHI